MLKCEYCSKDHDGTFASGRFCNRRCACTYASNIDRTKRNKKTSRTLLGRPNPHGRTWFSEITREKIRVGVTAEYSERMKRLTFDECTIGEKRRRIFAEQDSGCNKCKLTIWFQEPITLELNHINGNKQDESRENLELLCPNCHSQTYNFKNKGRKHSPDTLRRIQETKRRNRLRADVALSGKAVVL